MLDLTLFIYNVGLDKIPNNYPTRVNGTESIKLTSFSRNRSDLERISFKPIESFTCRSSDEHVKNYNTDIATNVKMYCDENKVDICILQEVCGDDIAKFKFSNYSGGWYRYDNTEHNRKKALIIGTYMRDKNIQIDIPQYIYGEKYNITNKMKMTDFPNNMVQTVRLTMNDKLVLYIINVHRRVYFHGGENYGDKSIQNYIKYICHLIGIIFNIHRHHRTPGRADYNIILCGDNNYETLDISNIIKPSTAVPIETIVKYIEELSQQWQQKITVRTENTELKYIDQIGINTILPKILKSLNFRQCIDDQKTCDFRSVPDNTARICNTKSSQNIKNINDIFYYRFVDDLCLLQPQLIISKSVCQFNLKTSSHLPYLIRISCTNSSKSSTYKKKVSVTQSDPYQQLIDRAPRLNHHIFR